jgi:hypothetical protein
MVVQSGGSLKERRNGQAGTRIGTGTARTRTDVTHESEGVAPSRLTAEGDRAGRLALPVRIGRSWLRHWLLYAEVVGAQWR